MSRWGGELDGQWLRAAAGVLLGCALLAGAIDGGRQGAGMTRMLHPVTASLHAVLCTAGASAVRAPRGSPRGAVSY